MNKGTEYLQPFDDEDKDKPTKKPKVTKDEYVDSAIKEDVKDTPTRSLHEMSELGKLVGEQFDDMNTFNIKPEVFYVR